MPDGVTWALGSSCWLLALVILGLIAMGNIYWQSADWQKYRHANITEDASDYCGVDFASWNRSVSIKKN
jgi:hypothetical protein